MFLGGVYYSNISGISGFIAIPSNHESLLCSNHASPLRVTMWCSSDTKLLDFPYFKWMCAWARSSTRGGTWDLEFG